MVVGTFRGRSILSNASHLLPDDVVPPPPPHKKPNSQETDRMLPRRAVLRVWWAVASLRATFARADILNATLSRVDSLLCEVVLNDIMFEKNKFRSNSMDEFFSCHPIEDETGYVSPLMYTLDLPSSLSAECRQRIVNNEDVYISIPGGKLTSHTVYAPNLMDIEIVRHERASCWKRKLEKDSRAVGAFKVLMLRVIANDSEPEFTAARLYNLTFRDDISLRRQMAKCSFGQLDIEPTEYGVLDVKIDMSIRGRPNNEAVNAAYLAAVELVKEDVRDVRELVDGVMFVIPPGSLGSWTAFGAFNGKQTAVSTVVRRCAAKDCTISHLLQRYSSSTIGGVVMWVVQCMK